MFDFTWCQTLVAAVYALKIYGIMILLLFVITYIWKFIDDGKEIKFFPIVEYFGKYLGFTHNPDYENNPSGSYKYLHCTDERFDNIWPIVLIVGVVLSFVILPILFIIFYNIIFFGSICIILILAYLARFTLRLYKRFNKHIANIELHNTTKNSD